MCADSYISKPFDLPDLLDEISHLMQLIDLSGTGLSFLITG